jgi:hypothetical protein
MNSKPSERVAVVGNIDPDAYTATTYDTAWIDMAKFRSLMAIIQAGDLGSSATIDAVLRGSGVAAGTSPVSISGKAITQLTQAGTDSNKQAIINLRQDELAGVVDGAGTPLPVRYISLRVTVGTATSDMGAVVLGLDAFNEPASDYDATSVDEIV